MEREVKIQFSMPESIRDWFRFFSSEHNRSMNKQFLTMLMELKKSQEAKKQESVNE